MKNIFNITTLSEILNLKVRRYDEEKGILYFIDKYNVSSWTELDINMLNFICKKWLKENKFEFLINNKNTIPQLEILNNNTKEKYEHLYCEDLSEEELIFKVIEIIFNNN